MRARVSRGRGVPEFVDAAARRRTDRMDGIIVSASLVQTRSFKDDVVREQSPSEAFERWQGEEKARRRRPSGTLAKSGNQGHKSLQGSTLHVRL